MRNPIDNLGDYTKVRIALQAAGGNKEILYKQIGDTAIAKAAPKLLAKGGVMGAGALLGVFGTAYGGYMLYRFIKDRREKIENEPALKKEVFDAIEAESIKINLEESTDSDVMNIEGVNNHMIMCGECMKVYDESESAKCPFCSSEKEKVQTIYIDEETGEVEAKSSEE
ncbi:MAG: hypothetical protein CVU95_07625 [Firmicutes bacterium HGW-Firmicutes-2]|jgi:hypothetical protein|nr:MAG: hypothetical protein CVU95_07625 [Firmicutes bacterium HGW-Firmicutes-2]